MTKHIPKWMKRALISGVTVFVLVAGLVLAVVGGNKYLEKARLSEDVARVFGDMRTMSFTNVSPATITKEFPIDIREAGNVEFAYATENFIGTASIDILKENGDTVMAWQSKKDLSSIPLYLEKGKYKMVITTAQWGYLKLGYREDSVTERYVNLMSKADSDADGLPDDDELALGTDVNKPDSDGDGLSDYMENRKYLTDPLSSDSDGDGVLDNDWDERREYTYTIQAIVDLRPPYTIEEMTDFYQDARLVKLNDDGSSQCEVIVYPDAEVLINPGDANRVSQYTEPTYTKIISSKMQEDMQAIAKNCTTDLQVLGDVLKAFRSQSTYIDPQESLGYGSSLPILFNMYKNDRGQVVEEGLADTSSYSIEEIKKRIVYADTMYELGVHGACGSTSVLKGAMMRAAGLEERTIFTVPLVFSYDIDNTEYDISSPYNYGELDMPSDQGVMLSDHFYHEVKIGNQWIRVDQDVHSSLYTALTRGVYPTPIYIKLLDCNDVTDENYYTTWNYDTFSEKRAYVYRSILQSQGIHKASGN